MIKARFVRKNDRIISFNIEGHSGYSEYGSDIVCSAVTAVSLSIGDGILEILNLNPTYEMKDGFLNMNLSNLNENDLDNSQILMKTLLLGLQNIEKLYSKYLKVNVEEV